METVMSRSPSPMGLGRNFTLEIFLFRPWVPVSPSNSIHRLPRFGEKYGSTWETEALVQVTPGDKIILHETVEMRSSSRLGSFTGTSVHEHKGAQTYQRGQQVALTKGSSKL